MAAHERSGYSTGIDALAFLCELAMLALLAVAGWGIGDSGLISLAFAVALPIGAALIWGTWMAPNSKRRLTDPARLIAQVVLFCLTTTLAVAAGHWVLGVTFAVVATAVFALTRKTGGVTGT